MNILGLSAFYHESACCLLQNGRLVAAAAEERFSRRKHDPALPATAFRFCLEQAGLDLTDLDAVAYYEEPPRKLARQLWSRGADGGQGWLDPRHPERSIREDLGFTGPLLTFPHHLAHAASAYFFSGFERAALLTADGVGEWATTSYGLAENGQIDLFEEVLFPHSLGLLYSTVTAYLGFRVNGGEYKVMGLAPYGEPTFIDQVCQLIGMGADGQFALNLRYFDFVRGSRMYAPELCELFGGPPRQPESEITQRHQDIARSLQLVMEEVLLEKAAFLHRRTGADDLCMAGGVALNCVANGRLRRESPFARLFVQPAAGDAGGCLGAAALAHQQLSGGSPEVSSMEHTFLGPRYEREELAALLQATELEAEDFSRREEGLFAATAKRLAGGSIVGWFQGAMEFGPRALGARSILADPRRPGIRDELNRRIKKRESFRPFAPCVLAQHAARHFALDSPSPFMLETCLVRSPLDLPGITHVDGSARPQTVDPATAPRLAALLEAFHERTGCPILVNTSFNVRGEPIVRTPIDALLCFADADLDALVLGDFMIDRRALPESWRALLLQWRRDRRSHLDLTENLYTFV